VLYQQKSSRVTAGANQKRSTPTITSPDRDQVKQTARGNWKSILEALGVSATVLVDRHGPCPACGGTDRFRYDDQDGDGTFFCNACGAGDGFKLLMLVHRWDFPQALQAVANFLGAGVAPKPRKSLFGRIRKQSLVEPVFNSRAAEYNELLWSKSHVIQPGTPPHSYLRTRCNGWYAELACESRALRWYESLRYVHADGSAEFLPGIVARVENSLGELVALHRTFLTLHGQKADVPAPKKLTKPAFKGAVNGAAIRLFEPEPEGQLIIGEGTETTLAAIHLWGIPGWAAISAGGMEQVCLPPLDTVRDVVIAVDHDSEKNGKKRGREAGLKLADRLTAEGRNVQLVQPICEGSDIDDIRF